MESVLDAMKKIYNLSESFGKFKETILITSSIKIPKSAHDTKIILDGVMSEVNCAMNYINNFVEKDASLPDAELSDVDKNVIKKAVETIDNWKVLCDQGVSIALSNNQDIQGIKVINANLKQKTDTLKNVTNKLKGKLFII